MTLFVNMPLFVTQIYLPQWCQLVGRAQLKYIGRKNHLADFASCSRTCSRHLSRASIICWKASAYCSGLSYRLKLPCVVIFISALFVILMAKVRKKIESNPNILTFYTLFGKKTWLFYFISLNNCLSEASGGWIWNGLGGFSTCYPPNKNRFSIGHFLRSLVHKTLILCAFICIFRETPLSCLFLRKH